MSPVAQTRGRPILAELRTARLGMVSWTADLAEKVLQDPSQLHTLLGVTIAEGFPNHPVRDVVLPTTLVQVRRDPRYGLWSGMIIHTVDRRVIGSMGSKAPPDDQGHVEIGYDIVPAYQGQGYATEIGCAFVHWLWEQAAVRRITAECLPDNVASIRVLEKLGLQRTVEQQDMLYWEFPLSK